MSGDGERQDATQISDAQLVAALGDGAAASSPWVHGAVVRSPSPCGAVRGIEAPAAGDGARCGWIDAASLRVPNVVPLGDGDQPILAQHEVRHAGEAVGLVFGPDPEEVRRRCDAIRVALDCTPPIQSIETALAARQQLYADDNVFQRYEALLGNLRQGFGSATQVVEDKLRIGTPETIPLSPQVIVVAPRSPCGVRIAGVSECDGHLARAVATVFGWPVDAVEIIRSGSSAAFDPTLPVIHAALLAQRSGRPVRLPIVTTADRAAQSVRHPAIVRYRSGFDAGGRLTARDVMVFLDGGAYSTISRDVLLGTVMHAAGPYRCPHQRVRGRVVATHTPPKGVFPWDGVCQAAVALELHMNRAAHVLGCHPLELRRQNGIDAGDALIVGRVGAGGGVRTLLDSLVAGAPPADPSTPGGSDDGCEAWAVALGIESLQGDGLTQRFDVEPRTGHLAPRDVALGDEPLACRFAAARATLISTSAEPPEVRVASSPSVALPQAQAGCAPSDAPVMERHPVHSAGVAARLGASLQAQGSPAHLPIMPLELDCGVEVCVDSAAEDTGRS